MNFCYQGAFYPTNVSTEVVITQMLSAMFVYQSEVSVATGRVDLFIGDYIVECKVLNGAATLAGNNWKHGLGQVLVYAEELKKKPALLFIGKRNTDIVLYSKHFRLFVAL